MRGRRGRPAPRPRDRSWIPECGPRSICRTPPPVVQAVVNEVQTRLAGLIAVQGRRSASSLHRELGQILWNDCGMERSRGGLARAVQAIPALRERFFAELFVPGSGEEFNLELERAGRVADFFELSELMCRDALAREESCGSHFRVEYATEQAEAKRNDAEFAHVAAWRYAGDGVAPVSLREPLQFEYAPLAERSYR